MTTLRLNPRQRWPDLAGAAWWSLVSAYGLAVFLARPAPLQFGLFLFTFIMMILLVVRRPAKAKGPTRTFWLALTCSFLPNLALRPAETDFAAAGLAIEYVGIVFTLLAILTLSRSFGIAPAHRGLVTHGPYRVLRHPLYAAELLFMAGYCVGYSSAWNWLVWLIMLLGQTLRIHAEEGLLSKDPKYREYQARVRWRLLPGVW